MGLQEYKAKRNFRRTAEPAGKPGISPRKKEHLFVVQKHDATRLHYDFRLELDGVLKSWAVPKGFPMKRGDRRLAVQVEDHPLDYARFEGTIPEGNYGAGTVMVWDMGAYQVEGRGPLRELEAGKLHLTLKGKKLKGEWTLVRMRPRGNEDKPQWLLLKSGDDLPELSARKEDQSVLSKRSLKQIAADNDAQWQSDRPAAKRTFRSTIAAAVKERAGGKMGKRKTGKGVAARSVSPARGLPGRSSAASGQRASRGGARRTEMNLPRLPKRKAGFVEPMKAVLSDTLPKGTDWIYELKFDGVRALAIKRQGGVELVSRNEKDMTGKFPEITGSLREIPAGEAVFDGEIVALDAEGRSSFQLLQAREIEAARPPIFYYVFDLVQLDGMDLAGLPLLKRKAMAQALLADVPDAIRFSAGINAESDRVLKEMKARGLEGLIAKRKDSRYEIGRRSGAWVKFKWTKEQEFVIGGYTEPRGARPYFGAILAGYYDRGKLIFASKVGTGFDQKMLKLLHDQFRKLARSDCPFANLPEKSGFHGRGLTAAEMRRCTWIAPKLVCQVRYAEWTRDGHLRQPAFLGLREDKRPNEVVREKGN